MWCAAAAVLTRMTFLFPRQESTSVEHRSVWSPVISAVTVEERRGGEHWPLSTDIGTRREQALFLGCTVTLLSNGINRSIKGNVWVLSRLFYYNLSSVDYIYRTVMVIVEFLIQPLDCVCKETDADKVENVKEATRSVYTAMLYRLHNKLPRKRTAQ